MCARAFQMAGGLQSIPFRIASAAIREYFRTDRFLLGMLGGGVLVPILTGFACVNYYRPLDASLERGTGANHPPGVHNLTAGKVPREH